MASITKAAMMLLGLVVAALLVVLLILVYQGRQRPAGNPEYVAFGSSFAAGIGLGARAPDSPFACMRTLEGYPHQLARSLKLALVDVSCSAATTRHVLHGGQYFQRPQLDALGSGTKLVTITSGGNDVGYVGDLSFLAGRNERSLTGWSIRRFWSGPSRPDQRDFYRVRQDLVAVVAQTRKRAPSAKIVLVTYPAILPPRGTCARLNIGATEAGAMRDVGDRLAASTRAAARESSAIIIDMQRLGAGHDACSAVPWVNGWIGSKGTRFHPTLAGAQAVAGAIAASLRARSSPAALDKRTRD